MSSLVGACFALAAAVGSVPVAGQAPISLDGLAEGPFGTLEMLYERTIFNIDILELRIVVDPETAIRLEELVSGADGGDAPDAALADRMVETIRQAGDVGVRTAFRRGVELSLFLDGMAQSLGRASDAGYLSADEVETIMAENRVHFGELEERGFLEDDTIWYRLRGDSLDMVLRNGAGETLLTDTRTGTARRDALLGGYLARGSDFREKLLESLFPG